MSKTPRLSLRSVELFFIDTLIIFVMWRLMCFLSTRAIWSMQIEGTFTLDKILALFLCLSIFRILFRMYNQVIRYANAKLYLRMMIADLLGGTVYFLLGFLLIRRIYVGFSYTLIIVLLIDLVTIASRLIYQLSYAYSNTRKEHRFLRRENKADSGEMHRINVAIVGAGNVGVKLAEEFTRNPKSRYNPIMFIDSDSRKVGLGIDGIHIFPENEHIVEQIRSMPVQEIIIALPDASPEDRARLFALYKKTNCAVKIYDYPHGNRDAGPQETGRRTIRDFRIEDLLFRDVIKLKSDTTKSFYKDKTVLVTGGGGSIGSELCRQIAKLEPKKLVIFDIYENNAYAIQQELIRQYGDSLELEVLIGSVRDAVRLEGVFRKIRPQIVFHAAAHKHVPLMEHSGCEAIKNNVLGTYNVANAAEKYGVEKFLLISTDKAVNPTNIMGASKRLCEMVIQCRKDSKTEFTAVRFGNVLGSSGSVIPLFKSQIEAGGPITLTDKRIIRYFMTIPEAVGLVMETCAMARNGELFVLDMGKPVKILDLAETMIKLSGLKPYEDIDIVEIGLRPGEKLYEELLMQNEELDKTDNELIFIERDKGFSREEVEEKLDVLRAVLETEGAEGCGGCCHGVLEAIRRTVPTYRDPKELNAGDGVKEEMQRAEKKAYTAGTVKFKR